MIRTYEQELAFTHFYEWKQKIKQRSEKKCYGCASGCNGNIIQKELGHSLSLSITFIDFIFFF